MAKKNKVWGDLSGKIAIVTGGSRGLGLDMARALVDGGAKVLITGRDKPSLERAKKKLGKNVETFAGDATDEKEVKRALDQLLKKWGRVDVLVNNAGGSAKDNRLMNIPLDDFDWMWQFNVRGPMLWIRECWHRWMEKKGGIVINIASAGGINPPPGMAAYGTSKAALLHLGKCLAAELGPKVQVVTVSPGITRSDSTNEVVTKLGPVIGPTLPMERLGEPEDISEIIRFIASGLAPWMTGENILIDGGRNVAAGKQAGFRTQSGVPGKGKSQGPAAKIAGYGKKK